MTSLYIHIPFCTKKCLFCSFVIAVGQTHRADDYIQALNKEAEYYRGTALSSIYFGGGTPTLLDEGQLTRLTDMVRANFSLDPEAEWTIEGNPEGLTRTKARALKGLGINRVSLGVQSFDDRYLKFLGRTHDSLAARRAFDDLRAAGFTNINVDLMYAFPGQSAEELAADVDALAALGSEHLSLYSLTIEGKSRFHAQGVKLDDENRLAEHYLAVCRRLERHGIDQYEVSNFSRDGFQSRHNVNYWRGGNYIGLGVGAHGHLNGRRMWNVSKLQDYLSRVQNGAQPIEDFEELSAETRLLELVVFGLRMNEGIVLEGLQEKAGITLPREKLQSIEQLIDDGFLILEGPRIKVSAAGRLILDEISTRLI